MSTIENIVLERDNYGHREYPFYIVIDRFKLGHL